MALDKKKVVALYLLRRRLQSKKRRFWIHPIFANRKKFGAYYVLLPQLKADDDKFFNYFRMDRACFDRLLHTLDARLTKISRREPISPEECLMVTLRFLASGDSYRSLSYAYRLADCTISKIVRETCSAIYSELKGLIRLPSTQEEWLKEQWTENTSKSSDHQTPARGTSTTRRPFSTVLLCVCDADYRVMYADFGSYGSEGDAGIYNKCSFMEALRKGKLNLPEPQALPGIGNIPYFLLGDGAFPLSNSLMKPFGAMHHTMEQRRFNYRLSRARRCIENTFGIMAAKFRILLRPIETSHEVSDAIVKAIFCLHNFLLEYSPPGKRHPRAMADYGLRNEDNGQWRRDIQPLQQATAVIRRRGGDVRGNSQEIRNKLTEYFSGIGAVGWQDNYL